MKSIVSSLAALVLLAACAGEFLYMRGRELDVAMPEDQADGRQRFGFCLDGAVEQLAGFFRRAFKFIKRTLYIAYPLLPKA